MAAFDVEGGALTLIGVESFEFRPWGVAVSPDGLHVYVTRQPFQGVSVYARDALSGELTLIDDQGAGLPNFRAYRGIVFGPDPNVVYIAFTRFLLIAPGGITVANRDPATGLLTPLQTLNVGIDGTFGIQHLAMSPGFEHLYAVGPPLPALALGGTLTALERNPGDGTLSEVETESNSTVGNALPDPRYVHMAPDGARIYVLNPAGNMVTVFERDAGTGAVSLAQVIESGVGEIDSMLGPSALAFSPDGSAVLVGTSDAILAFRIAPSGELGLFDVHPDATGGLPDLGETPSLFTAPDGRIFAAGPVVAELACADACDPTPRPGCRTAEKGSLALRDRSPDERDFLNWSWTQGAATTEAEFDGLTTHDFEVCVYEDVASNPSLALRAFASAGGSCPKKSKPIDCWRASGRVARYNDPLQTPDGLSKMKLSAGDTGKTRIKITGRRRLAMPALPLTVPVVVQLQSSGGDCWESTFSTSKNASASTFKARADAP